MRLKTYRDDNVFLVIFTVIIAFFPILTANMSCTDGVKDNTNFPQYSGTRTPEQRCQEPPDFSELQRRSDSLFSRLCSTEHRPTDEEEMFFAILTAKNSFLTLKTDQAGESCLLLFSSPIRANYYGSEVLGYNQPIDVTVFSASDIVGIVSEFLESGVSSVIFDRCVHCDIQTILPLGEIQSTDDVWKIWAVYSSTRILSADILLKRARELMDQGKLERAKSVCLDVIECVDVDTPDVHLLLGKCAVLLGDDQLTRQAYDFLELFKGDWVEKLRSFEKTPGL